MIANVHFGGSDGGAHCGVICDVSLPTYNLSFWGRDRTRGAKLPLEFLIHKQTQSTASLHGLLDRGVLKPGYKADINLIDFASLGPRPTANGLRPANRRPPPDPAGDRL